MDGVVPQAVARPENRQDLAALLRWASRNDVKLAPRGSGVFTGLGNPPTRVDVVVDLSRLNRVLDYEPADLTATVEAGITLEALRRELAQGDKYVPLEAPLQGRATVGGILATGYSGPLRFSGGLPRDWLIGLRVVGADGVETGAGGRVVKNVTGYDLGKLYTSSLGTLGIIVEASFKLAPLPDTWAAVAAAFPSMESAVAASRALVAQPFAPQGIQVVNGPVAAMLDLGFNDRESGTESAMVLAFVSGRPRAVARRLDEATRILSEQGAAAIDSLDESPSLDLLARLTDLPWQNDAPPVLGIRVSLPPSNVGAFVGALNTGEYEGIIADPGFGMVQLLRWRDDPAGQDSTEELMDFVSQVRRLAGELRGAAVLETCPADVKSRTDVWEGAAGPAELAIMRRIKHNFDPQGILNPGRAMGRL